MIKNVGNIDKILRVIIGITIIAYGIIEQSLLGLIGIVPIGTVLIAWCPFYPILGISTCANNTDKNG
jgi:hypothetical protein